MPTKWAFVWEASVGTKVTNQFFDEICQCVVDTNEAMKLGRFHSSLTFKEPVDPDLPRHLLGISLSEEPTKYYLILCAEGRILEMPWSAQMTVLSYKSHKPAQQYYFEGFDYGVRNQIQLRVGKIVNTGTGALKGIFMEVDYLSASSIQETRNLMEEYIEAWQEVAYTRSWPGKFVQIDRKYAEFGLSDYYTSRHTAVQYFAVMMSLAYVSAYRAHFRSALQQELGTGGAYNEKILCCHH